MPTDTQPAHSTASRWRYLSELVLVLALLGAFLSMMSVNDAVNGGIAAKLFLVGRMALLILICTWLLRRGGERWADVGLRRPPRWWLVPLLVVGGLVLIVTMSIFLVNTIFPLIGLLPPHVKSSEITDDLPEFLFFMIVTGWGTAAFGEEMLLRGFILDRIRKVLGSAGIGALLLAVVMQALLFGLFHVHQGLGGVLLTGTIGIVLGLVWLVGGRNLWACILLHGLVNTISDVDKYVAPSVSSQAVQQRGAS